MSFGPISLLEPRFKSSTYYIQYACGLKLDSAARVPAKPLSEDGILNQNPIFEMASSIQEAVQIPAATKVKTVLLSMQ